MHALPANEVVEYALGLSRESPGRPAIEILDRAMQAHGAGQEGAANADACLPPDAYLDPPSPFAELLRRAFAPGMDPRELSLVGLHRQKHAPELQQAVEQATGRWRTVMESFARRYRLWDAER